MTRFLLEQFCSLSSDFAVSFDSIDLLVCRQGIDCVVGYRNRVSFERCLVDVLDSAALGLGFFDMLVDNVLWGILLECDNEVGA